MGRLGGIGGHFFFSAEDGTGLTSYVHCIPKGVAGT